MAGLQAFLKKGPLPHSSVSDPADGWLLSGRCSVGSPLEGPTVGLLQLRESPALGKVLKMTASVSGLGAEGAWFLRAHPCVHLVKESVDLLTLLL